MKKKLLVVSLIVALALTAAIRPLEKDTNQQAKDIRQLMDELIESHRTLDTNAIFLTPSTCKGCHGRDPLGLANVTLAGIDINLFDDWETSMMGMAGIDPLWRAKVRHEVLVNPAHANELQDLCTKCHAPMGHFNAFFRGQEHYGLADLQTDSLGMAGVGCLGCHMIPADNLGTRFTGDLTFDTSRVAFGPFIGPFFAPMELYVGFTPTYAPHVSEGNFCSPCHTLISNSVDLEGNPTGNSFVEQATYHEWVNSAYPEEGKPCQNCHMPKIEDPVKIAVGYNSIPGRSPFNLHTFSGANAFMVNLIKQNKEQLNYNAPDANFDSSLAEITRLLRYSTIDAELGTPEIEGDSMVFPLLLTNKAGHKFPSGYPARRAFVSFVVTNDNGDTLFSSGVPMANGLIKDLDPGLHPHHQVISSPNQAQIYEMVMGDVNGDITTVLERGNVHLKDNRIPPLGFSTTHSNYDTCRIVGDALTDPDFNHNGVFEGTGTDKVYYKLPMSLLSTHINVSARVYYQSVPPHWLNEMRTFSAPEIDQFLTMYDAADKMAMLITEDTLSEVLVPLKASGNLTGNKPMVSPNPAVVGEPVIVRSAVSIQSVRVFTLGGQRVSASVVKQSSNMWKVDLPDSPGVYLFEIQAGGVRTVQKIIQRKL